VLHLKEAIWQSQRYTNAKIMELKIDRHVDFKQTELIEDEEPSRAKLKFG